MGSSSVPGAEGCFSRRLPGEQQWPTAHREGTWALPTGPKVHSAADPILQMRRLRLGEPLSCPGPCHSLGLKLTLPCLEEAFPPCLSCPRQLTSEGTAPHGSQVEVGAWRSRSLSPALVFSPSPHCHFLPLQPTSSPCHALSPFLTFQSLNQFL